MSNEESRNEDGATFTARGHDTAMQRQPARLLVLNTVQKYFGSSIAASDAYALLSIAPIDILVRAIERTASRNPAATASEIRFEAIGAVIRSRKAA